MKVEFDNRKYTVEFRHDAVPVKAFNSSSPRGGERERTTCFIRDAASESPGDGTHPVIAHACAVRHFRDTPNREAARKAALAKALDALFPGLIPRGLHRFSDPATRAARREFWDAYLNRRDRKVRSQGGNP